MMAKAFIIVFFLVFLTSISADANFDDARERFAVANIGLSGRYLYRHFLKYPAQSYTLAPLPVFCILSHIAYHAEGKAYERLMEFLNMESKQEIKQLVQMALSYLEYHSDTLFDLTIKVFGDDKEEFDVDFKKYLFALAKGKTGLLNYDCPNEAVEEVNAWFADQSSHPPKVRARPNMFQDHKGLFYVTSMDFISNFDHEYNPNGLVDSDYHMNETVTYKATALYGNGFARYGEIEWLDAKVIEFPLKGGELSVVIFYPNNANNLLELLRTIQNPYVYFDALSQAVWMCVKMHITVGRANVGNDMMELLPELHFNKTYLQGVFESDNLARVSNIYQQLHLIADTEVREGQLNSKYCPEDNLPFVEMNHPCAYYVLHPDGWPVYAGIL